jgi:ZIP family zinc transporter
VFEAAFWGFVGGFALIVGAVVALRWDVPQRVIALVMGFGAGVIIAALAFDLTDEAFRLGGADAVTLGLAGGAVAFFAGDWVIDHFGGRDRKRSGGEQAGGSGTAIALGALLDGIPESVALGISLLAGGGVSVAFVVAVFLSNVPEALSASTGLRQAGHSPRWILSLWIAVAAASALAAGLGYVALGGASPDLVAFILAFAAGAMLVMLADTMMPEAFAHGGNVVGLVTVLGFTLSYLISTLE